jgi:hypothetical protein
MRVRVREIGEGQHPSEKVVQINTKNGTANLVVDGRAIKRESLDVGYPVAEHGHYLVELPQETMTGEWRVWVPKNAVEAEVAA